MIKTNVMRLMDKAKITYKAIEYQVDESDLSGEHVANQLNQPVEKVFKTLVAKGDKTGYIVCCIPVHNELDLKKAAKVSGNKKVEMIAMKDLLTVTGYVRGGCSPVGMKKKFPVFMHLTAKDHNEIMVSAGIRGMQIAVAPEELINFIRAKISDLIKE